MKVLHSTCQEIWKTQQKPQDWKWSVFIPIPKKGNVKECSDYYTVALISQASKMMLKILHARPQQYMNWQLPDVKSGFRKGRGTNYQIANICWITEKAREFKKISTSASLTMLKPLTVWTTTNCGIFLKTWDCQTTLPDSWETCMQDKKQQLVLDMEQSTGSKLGKEDIKAIYCYPAYLNYTYSIWNAGLDDSQTGIKNAGRNITNPRYADDTTLTTESEESLLMKVKEDSEKTGLKLNIQKTNITASSPITSWQIDGKTMETVTDFIFLGSKTTTDGDCSHEIKRHLLLGRKAVTNLNSVLKSRDITLPTKVHIVKSMVFPVVMYGCESWTRKKNFGAEHQRIDAFELWCRRRLMGVPWTARDQTSQS